MEFLVAILMKITGVTSPWIFRSCTLLIAVIGMFYLYKLAFLLTNDWIKSLLVTAVAMTSPVYAYYFNGFIPSIPAFTFAIIAMYCYVKYININKLYYFICAMIFITLSLLTRTSFAVIYVALLGFEFLRIIRKESECNGKILPISISIIVFILYYLWNKHLSSEHGTLFLSELMPADDWNDFISRMSEAKKYWLFHYFTEVHYRLFAISILFVVLYLVYNKLLHGKIDEVNVVSRNNSLWIFIIVSILACIGASIVLIPIASELSTYSRQNSELFAGEQFKIIFNLKTFIKEIMLGNVSNVRLLNDNSFYLHSSIIVLPLIYFYYINKNITNREKKLTTIILTILLLSISINYINFIWHGFVAPSFFNGRYTFMFILFILQN